MNGCVGWVVNLANIQCMEIDAGADRGTRQYNLGVLRAADRQRSLREIL